MKCSTKLILCVELETGLEKTSQRMNDWVGVLFLLLLLHSSNLGFFLSDANTSLIPPILCIRMGAHKPVDVRIQRLKPSKMEWKKKKKKKPYVIKCLIKRQNSIRKSIWIFYWPYHRENWAVDFLILNIHWIEWLPRAREQTSTLDSNRNEEM